MGLVYELIANDTAYSVEGWEGEMLPNTKITIPNTYNGKPVTTIGGYAFQGESNLTQIYIPKNIIEIKGAAFNGIENLEVYFEEPGLWEYYVLSSAYGKVYFALDAKENAKHFMDYPYNVFKRASQQPTTFPDNGTLKYNYWYY